MNEESLFAAALSKAAGADRQAFLEAACGGDILLRQRIEQLLAADQQSAGILERGPDDSALQAGPSEPALAADRLFAGRFKLRQKLGQGGMGEVWVADQIEPVQRRVALKVVRPGLDSTRLLARFDQERQALALMDHPNIAKVLDAGVADGRPYFVMELIKGVPITQYSDTAKLSPRERLELFLPVCHAVQHAHQKGIIHRDLKPSNILIALYDGHPVPKVIDFGVAKATGPRLTEQSIYTEVGSLIGTLEYMSPEQAELNNLDVDTRSDIYALGAVLYELLTGSVPFSRKELQATAFTEMLRIIKEVDPPKPSARLSGSGMLPSVAAVRQTEPKKLLALIRGELDWIVMKCLDKDRGRRYATANALAQDLQRYLDDEAVEASPPSAGYRVRKLVRRNKGPVMAAALVLAALTAGMVGTTLGLLRASAERDEREKARQEADDARRDATAKAKAEGEARRDREGMLTDLYTSFGLAAGARDDPRQAVLWFAYAARLAGDDRERADANRTRAAAWGRLALQPVRALVHPAEWIENNMAYHPGGRHLLTHGLDLATLDTTCQLWDLEREAALLFPGNPNVVSTAAWDATGERLAVGTPQGEVTIWRFPSGEPLQRVPYAGRIAHFLFSPDGRYCAVDAAHRVRVWDCRQAGFATPELEHPAPIDTLAFHPQGELLATGCKDQRCRVFALPTEKNTPLFQPVLHGGGSRSTGLTPLPPLFFDLGRGLLTMTGEASWRDPRTGQVLRVLPFGKPGRRIEFTAIALGSDGKHVALAGMVYEEAHLRRPLVRIYDAASATPVSPNLEHRLMQPVLSAAFSPDGHTLLTGSSDHTARLWSVPGGKSLGGPLTHPTSVTGVAFASDGRHLATAQRGGLIRHWALPAGNPRDYRVPMGSSSFIRLSRDGRFLLPTGLSHWTCALRSTQVVDLTTGRPVGPPLEANGFILDAAFSPDGLQIATAVARAASGQERQDQWKRTGQQPGQLLLWDWRAGQLQHEPLPLPSEPRKLDYSPDGRQLAVIGAQGELVVIDPATGETLRQWPAHSPYLSNGSYINNGAVRFSPDNRSLLTLGTPSNSVRVWDALTGQLRYELKHKDNLCHDVQFSPDGRLAATAAMDSQVCVWELATGKQLAILAHPDWTFTASFSPDGKYLLTACRDGMARLWDWRAGRLVCPALEHEHEVHAVAFTPDGRHVLSASDDGVLKIWEWRTGKPVCPPLALGGTGLSLAVTPDGRRVACGGFLKALPVFHLDDWLAPATLAADDLCLWGEIVSGQRVEDGGGVTNLTADEWLQRWRDFRGRHPENGASP